MATTELGRTSAWQDFVQEATYVRNNPRFDIEERYLKLEVARSVRLALEKVPADPGWLSFLDAVMLRHVERHYFPVMHQCEWLKDWALNDAESLRQALCAFLDTGSDPEERFDRFAQAAQSYAAGRTDAGAILAFGSLFNFAQAPDTLPLVQPQPFRRLESLLGYERPVPPSYTEKYAYHLRFARQVQELLAHEPVRTDDMLDVQGLIVAASPRGETAPEEQRRKELDGLREQVMSDEKHAEPEVYLAATTVYRDHAPYLREWIEFHRLVGVERFFLYDNGSTDDHLDVLAPYLADGTVTVHGLDVFPPQFRSYRQCLADHRYESRWIAFIDIDEFLFCPAGLPLPEVLAAYEYAPAVGVNQVVFGTSGHRSRPDGPVIESYIAARAHLSPDAGGIKSIVDPRRVVDAASPHHFVYTDGSAVDENHYPIRGPGTTYASVGRLRINHYHTKSEEEQRAKYSVPRPDTGGPRPDPDVLLSLERGRYGRPDDAILRYVPALRQALGLP